MSQHCSIHLCRNNCKAYFHIAAPLSTYGYSIQHDIHTNATVFLTVRGQSMHVCRNTVIQSILSRSQCAKVVHSKINTVLPTVMLTTVQYGW